MEIGYSICQSLSETSGTTQWLFSTCSLSSGQDGWAETQPFLLSRGSPKFGLLYILLELSQGSVDFSGCCQGMSGAEEDTGSIHYGIYMVGIEKLPSANTSGMSTLCVKNKALHCTTAGVFW